jgi:hypothetical protein
VNGDGKKSVIVSKWMPESGWTLELFDPLTGKLVKSAAGYYVLWVGDLDGDGKDEIVVSRENALLPADYSTVEILSFVGPVATSRWKMDRGRLESRRSSFTRYGFVESVRGIKSHSTDNRQPFIVATDAGGRPDLLFAHDALGKGASSEVVAVGANGRGKFGVKRTCADRRGDLGTIIGAGQKKESTLRLISSFVDGVIGIRNCDERNVLASEQSFRTSQFRTQSLRYLVADLTNSGSNDLLVEDGVGVSAVRVVSATTDHAAAIGTRLLWRISGAHLHAVTTLDGGLNRTIISRPSLDGGVELAAVNGDGSLYWATRLPSLSNSYLLERPVYDVKPGKFTGTGQNDLFVVGALNIQSGNGDANRAWLLNGANGRIVWYNDASDSRFPMKSIDPGKEGGVVPVDLNGDGADDIAMVSQIFYLALDGKTGRLISDPEDVMHALSKRTRVPYQWTSWAATSLIDSDNDGSPDLLVHASTGSWGPLDFEKR